MPLPKRQIPSNVPVFRIDLSLPPRERYKEVALHYKDQVDSITPLFNDLLRDLGLPVTYHGTINHVARVMLRGVYSKTETAELQGISDVTGVDMYLLVALNVVLDLLMGCTSSTVKSSDGGVFHLRTLDWGMDPLRKIVVQLDFIRSGGKYSDSSLGGDEKVIASSITYFGFVGVLTGVKPGLSMSLNFRAVHNANTRWGHFRFYAHHLAVLLGFRQSISSLLREVLLGKNDLMDSENEQELDDIARSLGPKHTTAAYLTFCDGERSMVMEKDFADAIVRWDENGFLATTNHDVTEKTEARDSAPATHIVAVLTRAGAMEELLDDSVDRLACISGKWGRKIQGASSKSTEAQQVGVDAEEAIQWISDWPTTNETTHFATVMDAREGIVRWAHAYAEPVEEPR